MQFPIKAEFKLSESFIGQYKNRKAPFGFNGLGEFVYLRTYSRMKDDGKNEAWWETVRRVVEGIYTIQRQHIDDYNLGWNQSKAQKSAQDMYDRIFNFKLLPAGRSLWAMGSSVIMQKGLAEALYNCSFISTADLSDDPGLPFANAMDFLMCGIGVGADVRGAGKVKVRGVSGESVQLIVISDDREGWVDSLYQLITLYVKGGSRPAFDYSLIRPAGEPIKTFGGTASGPAPLVDLHKAVETILISRTGAYLTARDITDIFNLVGKAVIAGNVRRSAEIILGDATEEFLDLKNYQKNPDRAEYGWASNNSIFAETGMDYSDIAKRITDNGEPGVVWLGNAKKYGRMQETDAGNEDARLAGVNPCGEIFLEDGELCNLVELFPTNHTDVEDFKRTIKKAYLIGKTVTLLGTHWSRTNRVMLRNRRIGLSMTGLAQFVSERGLAELKTWMEVGYATAKYYDEVYSEWFAIPKSKRLTTVKPSGTLSLLAGVTPGIHFPESKFYIRRVRLANNSPFVQALLDAGYNVEPAVGQEDSTSVVEFPVSLGSKIRTLNDVSMWEQLNFAAFAQRHWADNSVSVTVTFKPEESKDIENALNFFQFGLKAVSFLPKTPKGAYAQMPYEEITEEQYNSMVVKLGDLDFSQLFSDGIGDKYCTNDTCLI